MDLELWLGRHGTKMACKNVYNFTMQLLRIYYYPTSPLIFEWITKIIEIFMKMIYTAEWTKKISKDILRAILRSAWHEDELHMPWVVLVLKQKLVVSVWHARYASRAYKPQPETARSMRGSDCANTAWLQVAPLVWTRHSSKQLSRKWVNQPETTHFICFGFEVRLDRYTRS